jgi:hypothetical protein
MRLKIATKFFLPGRASASLSIYLWLKRCGRKLPHVAFRRSSYRNPINREGV